MVIKNWISNNSILRIITAFFLVTGLWSLFCYCDPMFFSFIVILAMCIMLHELKQMLGFSLNFFLLAIFYPIIPCCIIINLYKIPEYKNLLLYLFVFVFIFDSSSYFFGKVCGKLWKINKIIPKISPGKSWEGAYGGYLTTTLLMVLFFTKSDQPYSKICLLSKAICIIAFTGDIFESFLKRSANIKDSGTILPGHGGFLDRFDAILFVSYFFFVFKDYLTTVLI